jgi:NAD binding domain of 6-phosphogluconate dehydrogenase
MTTERTDVGPGAGGVAGMVVGFVGLGNMGIPMTRRLVAAGYHVRGFDTSAQARGNFAAVGSAGAPGTGGTGTGTAPRSPAGSTSDHDGVTDQSRLVMIVAVHRASSAGGRRP